MCNFESEKRKAHAKLLSNKEIRRGEPLLPAWPTTHNVFDVTVNEPNKVAFVHMSAKVGLLGWQ